MATFNYKGTDWSAENVVATTRPEFVAQFVGSAYPQIAKITYREQLLEEVYHIAAAMTEPKKRKGRRPVQGDNENEQLQTPINPEEEAGGE